VTRLPAPEQWVLSTMNEMEVAEMIERYIEHYAMDKHGDQYPVHYPTPFVRHFMKRSDRALPTVVAIATAPIVLADGGLLAAEGLDRRRGKAFRKAAQPQGRRGSKRIHVPPSPMLPARP